MRPAAPRPRAQAPRPAWRDVPARLMLPRLVLLLACGGLFAFGCVMVFSASSATAALGGDAGPSLAGSGDLARKQLAFGAVGIAAAAGIVHVGYRWFARNALRIFWVLCVATLVMVFLPVIGRRAYGAARWLNIPLLSFQPSEFAKVVIMLCAASIFSRRYQEGDTDDRGMLVELAVGVVVPLVLILVEPDKGTTGVIALSLLVMGYVAGVPRGVILAIVAVAAVGLAVLVVSDGYALQRVLTVLNPESDPIGDGYQLTQSFYAFGSGGVTGVGLGMSRQKYAYLPMAYNDFILAVVGEECGLVGVLAVLLAFLAIAFAGLRVAMDAPDLLGRCLATGCTTLLVVQFFLNALGVTGGMPLSGKTVPFLSAGGTSVFFSFVLVGAIYSVSRASSLPETAHDRARRRLRVQDGATAGSPDVGEPVARGSRVAAPGRAGLTMIEGGSPRRPVPGPRPAGADARRDRPEARVSVDADGRRRIDLGPSASDRLRGRGGSGPTVRR